MATADDLQEMTLINGFWGDFFVRVYIYLIPKYRVPNRGITSENSIPENAQSGIRSQSAQIVEQSQDIGFCRTFILRIMVIMRNFISACGISNGERHHTMFIPNARLPRIKTGLPAESKNNEGNSLVRFQANPRSLNSLINEAEQRGKRKPERHLSSRTCVFPRFSDFVLNVLQHRTEKNGGRYIVPSASSDFDFS